MKSAFSIFLIGFLPSFALGFEGLPNHGSRNRTLPEGVTISKVAWPCQVIRVSDAVTLDEQSSKNKTAIILKCKIFLKSNNLFIVVLFIIDIFISAQAPQR